jgi:Arc/MetJ-type ribon-helix-helix transcriptional regulator
MKKTTVYLTEEEAHGLRRAAVREGRSQSELIREGVRRVIDTSGAGQRIFRSMGSGRGPGYEPWSSDELHDKVMGRRSRGAGR